MKNIFIIAYCLLITSMCFGQNYELKGNVVGLKSDSLLILKIKGTVFEGAKVKVVNGIFNYKDKIGEPYFIQLFKLKHTGETDGKLAEFMVESGVITIEGKSESFENINIKGSKSDLVLKSYLKDDQIIVDKWEKLKVDYDRYSSQNDTLNRKKVGLRLNEILFKERIPLLKKYVKANHNNLVGALLPNFCTLKSLLKPEDYLELYNMLTSEMKTSDYAKSTLTRSKS